MSSEPMIERSGPSPTGLSQSAPRLRRGSIGVAGMVFMGLAATAPLTAMASNLSISIGVGAGVGTLGWVLLIGALLAVYTAPYAALSRQVASPGAYHAYVSYGLGPSAGAAVAYIAGIAYNLACAAMIVATGFFTDLTLTAYAGIDLPWAVYSALALAVVGALGHFGVDVASKVTAVICVLQCVLLVWLGVAVLVDNPGGFGTDGFSPSSMFSGNFAIAAVFCLLAFGAYETAAIYGEECNAPRSSVQRATYLTLGLLMLIFLASTWTLIAAYPDVEAAGAANPGGLLDGAAATHLGSSAGAFIGATVSVSFLAASVAFHNMASRYTFAMGRVGLLPAALSRTHPGRQTPYVATLTQITINIVVIGPFVITGSDPLLVLFPLIGAVTSLAVVILTILCSLSAMVASLRGALPGGILATRVAPATAATGLLAAGALIVLNYDQVTGSTSRIVWAMPLVLVLGAAIGVTAARRSTIDINQALDRLDG